MEFADWEDTPVVVSPGEAWAFVNGAWARRDSTEMSAKARVVSEERFKRLFGELPPLPTTAFHSSDKPSKTRA
jgi:hypothetical protein